MLRTRQFSLVDKATEDWIRGLFVPIGKALPRTRGIPLFGFHGL